MNEMRMTGLAIKNLEEKWDVCRGLRKGVEEG